MTKTLDLELMDSKEYKAYEKATSTQLAQELIQKTDSDLETVISYNTVTMEQATQETKQVDAYQKAVAVKKDFDKALAEKNKPHKLAVKLASVTLCSRK